MRGGQVGAMKNLSRVRLSAEGQDAAVPLVEGHSPYAAEVEVLHTEPFLTRGHWVVSGRFAHELNMWDDATVTPLAAPLAAQPDGQSNLYAVLPHNPPAGDRSEGARRLRRRLRRRPPSALFAANGLGRARAGPGPARTPPFFNKMGLGGPVFRQRAA